MRASVYIKILFDFLCLIFSGFMYGRLIVSSLTDGQFRFFEIGDSVSSVEEEKRSWKMYGSTRRKDQFCYQHFCALSL